MNRTTEPITLPSYGDEHSAKYADTVVARRAIGSSGSASLLKIECSAGRYAYGATSEFALMVVESGVAADIDSGNGKFSGYLEAGELLFSPPLTPTDNAFHGLAKALVLAVAESRVVELLEGVDLRTDAAFRELYSHPLHDDFISAALAHLWSATHSRRRGEGLFADAAIVAIFAALPRHSRRTPQRRSCRGGLAAWQLRRALEKLESMWAEDLSLGELASTIGLSPFHFARGFKQSTGLSPHRYQLKLRLAHAKRLLTTTRVPVTDIALRVGYGSSQAFARMFHQEAGSSPSEYRRSTA
jgi:AraC family transcriptional regulator